MKYMNIGKAAVHSGVSENQLRTLADRKKIPYILVGNCRAFAERDIPAIRRAAIAAGYLPKEDAVAAS